MRLGDIFIAFVFLVLCVSSARVRGKEFGRVIFGVPVFSQPKSINA